MKYLTPNSDRNVRTANLLIPVPAWAAAWEIGIHNAVGIREPV